MAADLLRQLLDAAWLGALALILVALLRKPLRHRLGARIGYALWWLLPLVWLASLLPGPAIRLIEPAPLATTLPAESLAVAASSATGSSALPWLLLWAAGAAVVAAVLAHGQWRFLRSLGKLRPADDGSWRGTQCAAPALVGLWRPRIVLPADFEQRYSREEQPLVLAHEHTHLRHRDHWANAAAALALVLFWFNPMLWWALGRFRFDQELACDARVLEHAHAARRRYAEALMKTQLGDAAAWRLPLGCHWQSSHPLMERIAMLNRTAPGTRRRRIGLALVLAASSLAALAAWATQPGVTAPTASAAMLDLQFSIRIDGEAAVTPRVQSRSGETFALRIGEGEAAVAGEFMARQRDDGLIELEAKLSRAGETLGEPRIWVRPGQPGRIDISDDGGQHGLSLELVANPLHAAVTPAANATEKGDTQPANARPWQAASEAGALSAPKYPASALAEKLGGEVILHVEVLTDGSVGEIQIVSSKPPGRFEAATIEAVRHWKFTPERKNGEPVVSWVRVPVHFDPEGEPDSTGDGA